MHCQRQIQSEKGQEGTTVYFIPGGKGSVTGYSIFSVTSRKCNIHPGKKAKKRPCKRVVGVEVWLYSFLTSAPYRSLYATVEESKNCPFGVNSTIELKDITATSDSNVSTDSCAGIVM